MQQYLFLAWITHDFFLLIDFTYWKPAWLLPSLIVALTCSLPPNISLWIRASMFIWLFSSYTQKSGMKLSWVCTKILLLVCDLMLSSPLLSSVHSHQLHTWSPFFEKNSASPSVSQHQISLNPHHNVSSQIFLYYLPHLYPSSLAMDRLLI